MTNPVALRLRAISTGGGSQPNSKIKDLCSDGADEIEGLLAAIEELRNAMKKCSPAPNFDELRADFRRYAYVGGDVATKILKQPIATKEMIEAAHRAEVAHYSRNNPPDTMIPTTSFLVLKSIIEAALRAQNTCPDTSR